MEWPGLGRHAGEILGQTPNLKTQIPKPKAQAQPLSLEPVQIRVGRVEAALEAFPQHRPPGGTVILQGI